MKPDEIQQGDSLLLRSPDRTTQATVEIRSPNGHSLILTFEAIVDGFIGQMPAFYEGDCWRSITGGRIELDRWTGDD